MLLEMIVLMYIIIHHFRNIIIILLLLFNIDSIATAIWNIFNWLLWFTSIITFTINNSIVSIIHYLLSSLRHWYFHSIILHLFTFVEFPLEFL